MPRLLGNNACQKKGTIMDWLLMRTNTEGVAGGRTKGVARWFGDIRALCIVRRDWLEVRSTGCLSGNRHSSAEEAVSIVTSVTGAA